MFWSDGTTGRRIPGAGRRRGLTLMEMVVVLFVLVALAGLIVPLIGHMGEDARQQATHATLARVAEAIVGPGGYEEAMRFARDGADAQFIGHGTGLPWPSPAEISAGRADHPQLRYLFVRPTDLKDYDPSSAQRFYDPVARVGWRDAWLSPTTATAYAVNVSNGFTVAYGEGDGGENPSADDPAPTDGWVNPIVIQLPNADPDERANVRLVSAGPDGVLDTPGNVLTPSGSQKNDDVVLYLYREDPNP